MHEITLKLSGLSCMGCVKKLKTALIESEASIEILSIDTEHLVARSKATPTQLAKIISERGYQAGEALTFTLSGLNCGKCVAKVKLALEEVSGVSITDISKSQLQVHSLLPESVIINKIESLGFHAALIDSSENIEPPAALQESQVPKIAESQQSPHALAQEQTSLHILIQGMTCASCVSSVEKAILKEPNILRAQVNLAEQSALVLIEGTLSDHQKKQVSEQLVQTVGQAGYQAEVANDLQSTQQTQKHRLEQHQALQKRNTVVSLAIGAPLMLWGMLGGNMMIRTPLDQAAWGIVGLICLALLATAGRDFFHNAYVALKHKRATMDTLVALGTGAAWWYSMLVVVKPDWFPHASRHVYFEASAMIIGLISLGHFIEAKAKSKTNQSLQALMRLQPQHATAIIDGKETHLPIAQITTGMTLRIKPGEKVPVDGKIIDGHSYIDESMLTGEPLAISKQQGDCVSAGTLNSDGALTIIATSVGAKTMLSRIVNMVREAQSSKPAIAKLADSISAVFVPIVVLIAITAAGVWFAVGPEPKASYMLIVATTVLIIACPCALGLATPLSITVGIGKAAQAGVLIKDADALQTLSKVSAVVFDKTGTLTKGKPKVQSVMHFEMEDADVARYVVPMEQRSEHPLAKAVVQYWHDAENLFHVDSFTNIQGKGVQGKVDGQNILIASLNYVKQQDIDVSKANDFIIECQAQAWTPVVVTLNRKLLSVIAIADEIKTDAVQAIATLQTNGIHTVMLTGDNNHVAQAIAKKIGIDEVIAEVLPDDKAQHIIDLKKKFGLIAMVGDGINDAPALAKADVGIAMGSGSDIAIESAPMTLLNSTPSSISYTIELSKATVKNIKQNLFGAFIYNSLGIPIAAGILYPFYGFLLSPVVAGAAMALSSITVVTNANRLRNFK